MDTVLEVSPYTYDNAVYFGGFEVSASSETTKLQEKSVKLSSE